MLAGALIAGKEALAFIPNIEIVTVLLMCYTTMYSLRALYPAYVFVLVEMLIYGFGLWTFTYLYIWAVIVIIVWILKKRWMTDNIIIMAAVGGIYGLLFGTLSAIPTLVIGGPAMAWSYIIAGIPYDIGHCIGNVVTVIVLYFPIVRILKKVTF